MTSYSTTTTSNPTFWQKQRACRCLPETAHTWPARRTKYRWQITLPLRIHASSSTPTEGHCGSPSACLALAAGPLRLVRGSYIACSRTTFIESTSCPTVKAVLLRPAGDQGQLTVCSGP